MNLKKLSSLFLMLFVLTFASYAQEDQEETDEVGTKRSILQANVHDFGKMTAGAVQTFQFKIKNAKKTDMTLSSFDLPEGVGVTIQKKSALSGEEAIFTVTVNSNEVGVGNFAKDIKVKIERVDGNGVKVAKENTYTVKGVVE